MEKNGLRRGTWTKEEDILLKKCIDNFGEARWHLVPLRAGLNRCRKSCRLRWLNYLKPNLNRGNFNIYEIDLIKRLHKLLGNRWTLIAGRLPGRTANDIKNFWNTHLEKKSSSAKKPKAMITQSNIIGPRPRDFSKLQLVPSNCPSAKISVEDLNNKKPSSLGPNNEKINNKTSLSSSQEKAEAEAEAEADECIGLWCGNLLAELNLEQGEAAATPSIPLPDVTMEPTFLPGEDDDKWIESWWGNLLAEMNSETGEAAATPSIPLSNEDNVTTKPTLLPLPGEEGDDQCITRWWGNLLEMTETGEAAHSILFSDEDNVINKPT